MGIERALRKPGWGYSSSDLKYPLPDKISKTKEGDTWDFTAEEESKMREDWHKAEFKTFLKKFVGSKDVQEYLLNTIPK